MSLSNEHIITLQNVRGIGIGSSNKICDEVERLGLSGLSTFELYDLLKSLISSKALTRVTLPDIEDFEKANSVARKIMSVSESKGIHVVSRFEDSFPKMLLKTVDESGKPSVPVLLYYKGDLSITERPALAVIGTREPTDAGFKAGHYYAGAFAGIGVNIVSGLAIGCDTSGHRGALDAGGVTTSFLAHGLDTVYPKENESLAEEIVEKGGLLLSEYAIGTGVNRYNLVARDRLQAGLSNATLVVQTGVRGGTMHAVRATQQAGKPLMAVTYRDYQGEKEEGNRMLISQGAFGLRARKEEIASEPERFISMILGRPHSSSQENPQEEEFKDTLF